MNKYKRLAANTVIFAIGSFGSKILTLLLTRLYTYNLQPSDNSTKELLEITANFLIPIVTFSITDAIIRYGIDEDYNDKEVFSSACIIEFCGFIVFLALSPLIGLIPYTKGFLWYLIGYILASSLHALFAQFARARGKVKLFAVDGIFSTLTLFSSNILLIGNFHMGVRGFMLSVMFSDALSAVCLFFIQRLWRYFSLSAVNKPMTKKMLQFSVPLIPTAVLWIITGFSDRLFIRYIHGPKETTGAAAAGIYGVSSKIPNLVSTVSTIFFQAWNMSAIMENKSSDKGKFYENIYSAYTSLMFVASGFLIAFVRILSAILIDYSQFPEYKTAYIYTPVLVIAVLFMCFNQFLSSIYQATQKTTHSFWTALITAVINIVLNYFMITAWGIMGAVIATFVSYFVCYVIRIWDARKLIRFKVGHVKFYINTCLLFIISLFQILEWQYYYPVSFALLAVLIIINFKAVILTAKKLLKRG